MKKMKKIGEIWATESTVKKYLYGILVDSIADIIIDDYSCVIKKSTGIKYNVFGYDRSAYDDLLFKIRH